MSEEQKTLSRSKRIYRSLCEKESTIPLFLNDWWLDAVCGENNWHVILVENTDKVTACMPYFEERKLGKARIQMPKLTQFMGPWIWYPAGQKRSRRLRYEKTVMTKLIEAPPPVAQFQQSFHFSITNWLPFYWSGYQQTTRYTYIIENLRDLDAVWQATETNIKTDVRKARKQLTVRNDLGLDKFLDLNEMTFRRQGISLPYSRDFVTRLDEACAPRGCRKMFFAEDDEQRVHAAVYIVWDEHSAYYLMGGSDPKLRRSGAMSLLMWEAISFAATVSLSFDFEGSMIEPVERFFRAFGARQQSYLEVSRIESLPLRIYHDVRTWSRILRGQ